MSPALAPAVLDLLPADAGAALELVRGDAYRLLGREGEAQRAYASALAAISAEPQKTARGTDPPAEPPGDSVEPNGESPVSH